MSNTAKQIKSIRELRQAAVDAHHKGDLDQAREFYRLYLRNRPTDAAIWSNLGALFRKQKNYDLAAAAQMRALELEPDTLSLMNNAANAFFDAGKIDKALELRENIIHRSQSDPDNYASLGKCYRSAHQLEKALKILNEGLEKFPDFTELHIQLAFTQLAMGDYPGGFKSFDWRWKGDELSLPDFAFPKWNGEPLKGKTIVVTPEQGFGDTVLMARFLPAFKKLGGTIKLLVKPPLIRLFDALKSEVTFISTKGDVADCDYWVPMMDLPLFLGADLDALPKPAKLSVPAEAAKRARQITAPYQDRFKLGVMWSGSVTYRANHKRSFDHQRFLELSDIPGLQMFSLYKGPMLDTFNADGTSTIIVDAAGNDRDFADSAALMQELDLVVSMDSAIVHVAGSLGIEVWNLLHSESYWLYEPYPDHTPWYPSMQLIKQKNPGDWDGVFKDLKIDIAARVKEWKQQ